MARKRRGKRCGSGSAIADKTKDKSHKTKVEAKGTGHRGRRRALSVERKGYNVNRKA